MFGHVRGSFTGAVADRKGKFESANDGTLFLDEIGDMSLITQVKLLRVLQEGEVTPVGSSATRPVDVRILAATSKNLARGDRARRLSRRPLRSDQRPEHRGARPCAAGGRTSPTWPSTSCAWPAWRTASAQAAVSARRRLPDAAALARQRARAAQRHGAAGGAGAPRRGDPSRRDVGPADGRGGGGGRRRPSAPAPGAVALRAAVHPRAPLREPRQPGPDRARAGHRAHEPLPEDEAAGDSATSARSACARRP